MAATRRSNRAVSRGLLIAAALGLGALIAQPGVARWMSRSDPARAARIAPYDARLAVAAAQARINSGAPVDDPGAQRLAAAALKRDVTLTNAIEMRALQAGARGDRRRETRLFELSDAISRRSLGTRLWLIQRSVDRGEVAGALANFEIALRTSPASYDILFPVLARASSDPALAGPIAQMLDRPQEWREMFLRYAIVEANAAPGVADVVLKMRNRRAAADNGVDELLVSALIDQQAFGLARQVSDAFHPTGEDVGLVRDPDFSNPDAPYPFGWRLIGRGDRSAQRSEIAGRPALAYRSSPGGSGAIASQLLTLAPGGYRLSVKTTVGDSDGEARPYWTLACVEGGQLARLDQPAADGASAALDFTVPPDCAAAWLRLALRPSALRDRQGAVARVSIEARQGRVRSSRYWPIAATPKGRVRRPAPVRR